MYRTFRHVNVDLVPVSQGGENGGQPQNGSPSGQSFDSKLQQLAESKSSQKVSASPSRVQNENKEHSRLSYQETKEKLQKDLIRQMLEKLVIDQVKDRKIGADFYDKRNISRDVCIDAEFRIPNETFSIRRKPMHFYFDFSGSCEEYSGMFAQITSGLIEKGAITYIGENGYVDFRIDKAPSKIDLNDIHRLLYDRESVSDDFEITYFDEPTIKEIIIEDKIERLICYTDYDSCYEMVDASSKADLIWFSAQDSLHDFNADGKTLEDFRGRFYQARNLDEIKNNLMNFDNPSFERHCRLLQMGHKKK